MLRFSYLGGLKSANGHIIAVFFATLRAQEWIVDLPGGPRDAAPGKRGNDEELGETIARGAARPFRRLGGPVVGPRAPVRFHAPALVAK